MRLTPAIGASLLAATVASSSVAELDWNTTPLAAVSINRFDFQHGLVETVGFRFGLEAMATENLGIAVGFQDFGTATGDYAPKDVLWVRPIESLRETRLRARGGYTGLIGRVPLPAGFSVSGEAGAIYLIQERRNFAHIRDLPEYSAITVQGEEWVPYLRAEIAKEISGGMELFISVNALEGQRVGANDLPERILAIVGRQSLKLRSLEIGVRFDDRGSKSPSARHWHAYIGPALGRFQWLKESKSTVGYAMGLIVQLHGPIELDVGYLDLLEAQKEFLGDKARFERWIYLRPGSSPTHRLFEPFSYLFTGQAVDLDGIPITLRYRHPLFSRFDLVPEIGAMYVRGSVRHIPDDVAMLPLLPGTRYSVNVGHWALLPKLGLEWEPRSGIRVAVQAYYFEVPVPNPALFIETNRLRSTIETLVLSTHLSVRF